jgi:hypothetical protein
MLLSRGNNPGRSQYVASLMCSVAIGTHLEYPYRPLREQPAGKRVFHSSRVSGDHVNFIGE